MSMCWNVPAKVRTLRLSQSDCQSLDVQTYVRKIFYMVLILPSVVSGGLDKNVRQTFQVFMPKDFSHKTLNKSQQNTLKFMVAMCEMCEMCEMCKRSVGFSNSFGLVSLVKRE